MQRDASGSKLALGEKAPYFSLRGTDGRIHTISDYTDKRSLVVVFTCNHCPYAQAYEQRLISLANRYQPRGAQFITICANDANGYPEDDFPHMVEKASSLKLPFPYLHDESQITARAYDAACTPEVYVFNEERSLCYHGAVDNNHKDATQVTAHYLADALDAVLSGEQPKVPVTSVIGCSIKWK